MDTLYAQHYAGKIPDDEDVKARPVVLVIVNHHESLMHGTANVLLLVRI